MTNTPRRFAAPTRAGAAAAAWRLHTPEPTPEVNPPAAPMPPPGPDVVPPEIDDPAPFKNPVPVREPQAPPPPAVAG